MKKLLALGCTLLQVIPVFAFDDIQNSWYRESIESFTSDNIVSGYNASTFAPHASITRAELTKVALNAAGIATMKAIDRDCFEDTTRDIWLAKSVCTAFSRGIVRGENGRFRPSDTVTIAEVLIIAMRTHDLISETGSGVSLPFSTYSDMAHTRKIIARDRFNANQVATRGQAIDLLWRVRASLDSRNNLSYNSFGCTQPPTTLPENASLSVNGKIRNYILSVPANPQRKPVPLIIAFHGRTNSNATIRNYMGLEGWRGQPREEAIIAYPAGLSVRGGFSWGESENIDFFDALITKISRTYCIDRSQVLIVGHSLGAYMAHKTACLRWDIVRAVTAIAGPWYSPSCTGPTKALIMHNPNDPLVPFSQGLTAERYYSQVNGCSDNSRAVMIWNLTCQERLECIGDKSVIWCPSYPALGNEPHSWPANGGSMILNFFKK